MTVNTNGPLAGQETPQFMSVDLGALTQRLIVEMDRLGKKIRRDEWEFGGDRPYGRIRINYAHREQRIHLSTPIEGGVWRPFKMVSVNLDATDWHFPKLEELLGMFEEVVGPRPESVVRREA